MNSNIRLKGDMFENGNDYRNTLIADGYSDWGWQNGWGANKELLWSQQRALDTDIEHHQFNRSGSDCITVLHDHKVFSSVDMGD